MKWLLRVFTICAYLIDSGHITWCQESRPIFEGNIHSESLALLMPVELNEIGIQFQIDTGANSTVIDPNCAKFICQGMKAGPRTIYGGPLEYYKARNSSRSDLGYPSYLEGSIRIGESQFALESLRTWPIFRPNVDHSKTAVMGLLGFDVISRQCLEVNYSRSRFAICENVPKAFSEGTHHFPLIVEENLPKVEIELNGKAEKFIVDTGSSGGLLLSDDLFERYKADRGAALVLEKHASATWSDRQVKFGSVFTSIDIDLGGYRKACQAEYRVGEDASLLGVRFLCNFDWCFDFPNKKVYIKPSLYFADEDTSNSFGIETDLLTGKLIVFSVASTSVAKNAGVEPGDWIKSVEINRKSFSAPNEMRSSLRQAGKGTVRVVVDRLGDLKTIVLREDKTIKCG